MRRVTGENVGIHVVIRLGVDACAKQFSFVFDAGAEGLVIAVTDGIYGLVCAADLAIDADRQRLEQFKAEAQRSCLQLIALLDGGLRRRRIAGITTCARGFGDDRRADCPS